MFSLFLFHTDILTISVLDVANEFVYCTSAAACNYRPRALAIGALEQDKKFISINYYPFSSCCAKGAKTEFCKNGFRTTFAIVVILR